MKRIFATLVLLALLATPSARAQESARYGVTAGFDVSSLSFKQDLFKVNSQVGFSVGMVGEMIFPGAGFGIDTGILYQMRGARLHLGDKPMWSTQGYTDPRCTLHYLDIPLHLRFKYTNLNGFEDYIAPFAFAGPDFGFLLGHSKIDAIEYAGGQIGLSVGGGAEIYRHWQVSLSYTWGVTYALKMAILSNESARCGTFNVRLAYMF